MAAKKNPFIEIMQQRLVEAGLALTVNGVWDEATRTAMRSFQTDNDLTTTLYPNAETLALLGVPPSAWATIAMTAGAPAEWVAAVSATASKQIAAQVAAQTREAFTQTVGRSTTSSATGPITSRPTVAPPSGSTGTSTAPSVQRDVRPDATAGGTRPAGSAATATTPDQTMLTPVPLTQVRKGLPVWGWVAISLGAATAVGVVVFLATRSRRKETI